MSGLEYWKGDIVDVVGASQSVVSQALARFRETESTNKRLEVGLSAL